ncbi:MAG: hypothetical protein H0V09_00440 [Gemmatimonadetes bacterium]|nr:hypothetical protein [Gemmatimonadota bacterium]
MSSHPGTAYEVPQVFEEAAAAGFKGFELAVEPEPLLDPEEPSRTCQPGEYTHATIVNGRAAANDKSSPPALIAEWNERAERVLARGNAFETVALIGGMPVRLRTNSPHLINFWRQNWFLADADVAAGAAREYGIPVVGMRAAIESRDPTTARAFYCRETNETVFSNTDYYGQMKSWALGAAGVELAKYGIHSVHGACIEVDGMGMVIIAPTGTGKSTYTNLLSRIGSIDPGRRGRINSDDWVYVKGDVATPSERRIYVRTNAVDDALHDDEMDATMRRMKEIFDVSPSENVPVVEGSRLYSATPNSRCMIDPAEVAEMTYGTRIHLIVLLRRDDVSPFERVLGTEEALEILEEGAYMIQPGAGPKEKWGQMATEPWYNPYLLRPDREFERRSFASYSEDHGVRYVVYNTGTAACRRELGLPNRGHPPDHEELQLIVRGTAQRMLRQLEQAAGA